MQKTALDALARQEFHRAQESTSRRSATTVYGDHTTSLRQTMLTLLEGTSLDEHESPGEATLLVLRGRVRVDAGGDTWEARQDDLLPLPDARHSLTALADSVVVLTVATRP